VTEKCTTTGLPDGIHIFKPKIQCWVNFGGSFNEDVGIFYYLVYVVAIRYISWPFGLFYVYLVYFMAIWYILCLFGIFYGYLVYFTAIWYILWLFGICFPILVCCTKKNLATLHHNTAVHLHRQLAQACRASGRNRSANPSTPPGPARPNRPGSRHAAAKIGSHAMEAAATVKKMSPEKKRDF
jgi:hypothetical protein